MPLVSILLPVRNGEKYIRAALDSLLVQSFRDFEVVVIDDGSEDATPAMLSAVHDSRVRVTRNEASIGVARALNQAIGLAQGAYLARMDADDRCPPARLARQVEVMNGDPGLGILGGWVRVFGAGRSYLLRYPWGAGMVKAMMVLDNPLAHPSVMMRRDLLDRHALRYDEACPAAQDFELWARAAQFFQVDNLPEVLVEHRVHGESVSLSRQEVSNRVATEVLKRELERLGMQVGGSELQFHREVGHGAGRFTLDEVKQAEAWLEGLLAQNARIDVYPAGGLAQAVGWAWFRLCQNSAHLGMAVLKAAGRSRLAAAWRPGWPERLVFSINALRRRRGPTGRLASWDKIS